MPTPIRALGRDAALLAGFTSLAYAGMKVAMALRGELGLPGFPPRPTSNTADPDIARNEWMLALLGLIAAGIAYATCSSLIRRVPRWIVVIAVLLAGGSQAAGAIGMTLRVTRLLPDLGPGPQGWSTWIVLVILDVGAIAWVGLGWILARHGHIADEQE